ncbi:MAG: ester cyclase [Dehalococcoidia bacterium]
MPANSDLIRGFVEAMNRHDPDAVLACYAPDARIVYPGREPQKPAEYVASERAMLESVPDYRIEAISILEAGDHVVLELRAQGTQRPDLGGRSFSITGAYIFRLAEGRIVEERAYPDIAGLRRQLSPR